MMYPLLQKYNTKIFPLSKFFFHQSQNIFGFYPCVLGSFLKPSMTISEQNWHSTIAPRQQQCCWCHPQAMNDTVYTDSRRIKASLGSQVEYCQIFKAPSQAMIIREMIGNKQKAEGNFWFFSLFLLAKCQVPKIVLSEHALQGAFTVAGNVRNFFFAHKAVQGFVMP